MKITIAGAGEVGTHLAEMLSNDQHDITVIDQDEENIKQVDAHLDILTIHGSCTSFNILEEAGIKHMDLFVAVTQSEETNIVASILAKKLGAKQTVARIDNGEYLWPKNKKYFQSIGIDSVICPEKLAANEIVALLKQTGSSELFEFSGGKLLLFTVKLDENAPILNKTLEEAAKIKNSIDYRAVAITRDDKTIIPTGHDVFKINDLVYVITNQGGIDSLMKYAGKKHIAVENIMILGGSRIGMKSAKDLEDHFNIKIIESNKDRCYSLADALGKSLVINGDVSNVNLLHEEGLKKMDAFIAVTDNTETNILSCLYAKKLGVKKTIAEIENIDYIDLAENIGIDTIINKKLIAASHIFRYTMRAKVESLKCLTGANAEVFEFEVRDGAKITKHKLKDINFPENAIIGGVVRNNCSFIAKGETKIIPKDRVVVFSLPSAIQKVDKFFN